LQDNSFRIKVHKRFTIIDRSPTCVLCQALLVRPICIRLQGMSLWTAETESNELKNKSQERQSREN